MRYWLILAEYHVMRRDPGEAMIALRFALADANRDCKSARPAIMRAMNYARAISARGA
jgi:hypothetical protein